MDFQTIRSRMLHFALRSLPVTLALAVVANPLFAQEAEAEVEPLSLGGLIADSGPFGWAIIVLSVVALAVVIENFVSLKREKLAPPELIDEIQALFDEGQYQEAMELCENEETFLTRICGAGIAKIGHSFEVIEKSLEEMGDEEAVKLHQKMGWLSLIANVAPMMGLLGTVSRHGHRVQHDRQHSGGNANPAELARRYLPGAPDHALRPGGGDPGDRGLRLPAQQPDPFGDRGGRDRRGPLRALPPRLSL